MKGNRTTGTRSIKCKPRDGLESWCCRVDGDARVAEKAIPPEGLEAGKCTDEGDAVGDAAPFRLGCFCFWSLGEAWLVGYGAECHTKYCTVRERWPEDKVILQRRIIGQRPRYCVNPQKKSGVEKVSQE